MTREIPPSKKLEVVKLYFEGLSYDEIAKRTGVAKGTVTAIVEELKDGKFPQFERVTDLVNEVGDLAVGLRKASITITEAAPLFILVKKLVGLGVEPPHLESWVKMCREVPEGEFSRSQIIQSNILQKKEAPFYKIMKFKIIKKASKMEISTIYRFLF